jgi:hypothetical protein
MMFRSFSIIAETAIITNASTGGAWSKTVFQKTLFRFALKDAIFAFNAGAFFQNAKK